MLAKITFFFFFFLTLGGEGSAITLLPVTSIKKLRKINTDTAIINML